MNAKQIIHNYMLSAVKTSNKTIKVKCVTIADGKKVYSTIFEAYPAYAAHIKKVSSGINYKDFTLKFDAKWATDEFLDILLKIKSDVSLKVQDPTPPTTEAPKWDDPTNPAPNNPNTNTNTGTTTSVFYSAPGANALNTTTNASGSNSKILIIAGVAVVVLVAVLLLLKKRKK